MGDKGWESPPWAVCNGKQSHNETVMRDCFVVTNLFLLLDLRFTGSSFKETNKKKYKLGQTMSRVFAFSCGSSGSHFTKRMQSQFGLSA